MFAVTNEHYANENIGIEVRDHSLSMQDHFQEKKVALLTVWAPKLSLGKKKTFSQRNV